MATEEKPEKVAFVNAEKDGRFSFYDDDGKELVVADKPFETDDAKLIAFLDASDAVKRQTKSGGKD